MKTLKNKMLKNNYGKCYPVVQTNRENLQTTFLHTYWKINIDLIENHSSNSHTPKFKTFTQICSTCNFTNFELFWTSHFSAKSEFVRRDGGLWISDHGHLNTDRELGNLLDGQHRREISITATFYWSKMQ